jgi:hypothetical protein
MLPMAFLGALRPTTAKFVIASWDYPDEYGQGVDNIEIWQYIDSSWVKHPMTTFGYGPNGNDTFEIEAGGDLLFEVDSWLNGTFTGISSLAEGRDYLRYRVVVTTPNNDSVITQEVFTYMTGSDALAPMYYYKHNITLSFSPAHGVIYTAVVYYEVFI